MTHILLGQIITEPSYLRMATIDPAKAKAIAQDYLRSCIKREIELFHAAELHSRMIASEGINSAVANKTAYLAEPSRTGRRFDFMYSDFKTENMRLFDDSTIIHGIDRERIFQQVKEDQKLDYVDAGTQSDAILRKWINKAIDAGLEMHKQHLEYETDIQFKDKSFDYAVLRKEVEEWSTPKLFVTISKRYLEEFVSTSSNPKSLMKKQAAFDLWHSKFGGMPFQHIDKTKALEFKNLLLLMPRHFTKKFPKLSVKEVTSETVVASQRIDQTTVNGYLMEMGILVNWARRHGLYSGDNPFEGMAISTKKKAKGGRKPFSPDALSSLFGLPTFTGCASDTQTGRYRKGGNIYWDSYYWLPILGLFTGARMQELCQLKLNDIKQIPRGFYLDLNEDEEGKHLKTQNSKRKVPFHPQLIALGFLDFIEHKRASGADELFSDIPVGAGERKSSVYSKRFRTMRNQAEIKEPSVCFHSFRHNFIDAMRNAQVMPYVAKAISGHSEGQNGTHDNYGQGPNIEVLFDAVEKITFPISLKRKA